MNTFGNKIKLSISGENSASFLLVNLEGFSYGETIDLELAYTEALCAKQSYNENRPSQECFLALTGLVDGKSDGGVLSVLLYFREPTAAPSSILRPGHEDFVKFSLDGTTNFTGGAYSGRVALALSFAGAICEQVLLRHGIQLSAKLTQIGKAEGEITDYSMKKQVLDARSNGDSVGSCVRCEAYGLEIGLGEPVFCGLQSKISALLFSLAGVSAVGFGDTDIASMKASETNDEIILKDGKLTYASNHSGGVEAGYSTGMDLCLNVSVKPTPTMAREQKSVDISTMKEVNFRNRGRYIYCLGESLMPAIKGAVAFCILDSLFSKNGNAVKIVKTLDEIESNEENLDEI